MNTDLYIRSITINKKATSDEYPFNLPIFQQLDNLELKSKVITFANITFLSKCKYLCVK